MRTKKSLEDDKDAAEALIARRGDDDSDIDDDQVADLSAVPTPVIGFKMPNLNRKPEHEGKKMLSANLLNNTIVNMRAIVEKAKFFEEIQCKRKMKRLEENPKASDSAENKIDRIREDINAFKTVTNDEVSKFAILNKKSRGELLSKKAITPDERSLYLLVTSKTVVKAVDKFRKMYDDWEARTPYFLQRLGQQHQAAKEDEKKKDKNVKKKRKAKAESNKEIAATTAPVSETIVPETSQAVVKRIKLSEGGIINVGKPRAQAPHKPNNQINDEEDDEDIEDSGFFLNALGAASNVTAKKPLVEKVKRTPKPNEQESLHPSWAAKLKNKKLMENAKPQGKKIVFDDDE